MQGNWLDQDVGILGDFYVVERRLNRAIKSVVKHLDDDLQRWLDFVADLRCFEDGCHLVDALGRVWIHDLLRREGTSFSSFGTAL